MFCGLDVPNLKVMGVKVGDNPGMYMPSVTLNVPAKVPVVLASLVADTALALNAVN